MRKIRIKVFGKYYCFRLLGKFDVFMFGRNFLILGKFDIFVSVFFKKVLLS